MPGLAPALDTLRTALPQLAIREEGRELIASPASTEEVSALLAHCNTHHIPFEITGARTKRNWAGMAEAQLILDTSRLTGVSAHPWQDLTATVGAGTPWAEMQRVLAAHNQFVALDPLWPERATVGGVLSTNDSGALRLKYGSARDLVIGMTLVLADGTIARTGGRVVKNVAGYDLHKLMIGAFGTLSVITEVTFRLHPLPQHRAAWTIASPVIEPIARLSSAVTASHLNPEAVQLRTTPDGFALDVLLAAAPEVLRTKGEVLATLAGNQGLAPAEAQDVSLLLNARQHLFVNESGAAVKATMLPAAVPAAVAQLGRAGHNAAAVPLGIVWAGLRPDDPAVEALRSHAEDFGGALTTFGESAPPTALMREIKCQFDPDRILNRGLMGGI